MEIKDLSRCSVLFLQAKPLFIEIVTRAPEAQIGVKAPLFFDEDSRARLIPTLDSSEGEQFWASIEAIKNKLLDEEFASLGIDQQQYAEYSFDDLFELHIRDELSAVWLHDWRARLK
ncbi:hypothetical protein [Deinococcus roseus]|uniref:Uncharacterized protein n=1 Tax=Deinococcus roseus TaxID=392414 RepID=A0ABQ2DJB8_9DEIO|nr:hypothetical protein [Deinococcus roseus]GGJ60064.1 hypothetical protein GCM10008938_52730 [Deinococcus roseus]